MVYEPQVVNCTIDPDPSNVSGKTAIATGGANGIGEAYVRALHAAKLVAQCLLRFEPQPANNHRVSVVFGDLNERDGHRLAEELKG